MYKVLITGAGGFVGKSAVSYFLDHGYFVRAMVHRNYDFPNKINLEVVQGDMGDESFLRSATRGIDAVIHLAAAKSDESDSYKTNVEGARNLELAAFENGVKRIVVLSTLSTKIARKGIYAKTKSKADKIFLHGRVPTVILLSSVIYGDISSGVFGSMVKFSRLPIVPVIGSGIFEFAPIHVLDVIHALDISLSDSRVVGKVYDIGGPDRISFNDCIRKIGTVINGRNKVPLMHIPINLGYCIAYIGKFIFKKPPITLSNIYGSSQGVGIDTGPFLRDFNFVPIGLDEGLRRVIASDQDGQEIKEARLMLQYIRYGIDIKIPPTREEITDYIDALSFYKLKPYDSSHPIFRYPWLLGPIDAISRIKYKNSNLQRKLLIATALTECTPESFGPLLSGNRSLGGFIIKSMIIGTTAILKLVIGMVLPYGFIKNYVE